MGIFPILAIVVVFLVIFLLATIIVKVFRGGKSGNKADALGYFSLGVLTDYFIFKPARAIRPLVYAIIGFILGMLYTVGLERIVEFSKNLM